MATLTPEQELTAKAWLNDFFVLSGFMPEAKDRRKPFAFAAEKDYTYMQYSEEASKFKAAAEKIMSVIKRHEMVDVDKELKTLSKAPFGDKLAEEYNVVFATDRTVAAFIAYFCARQKFFWDDISMFDDEKEEFESTILGQAAKAFGAMATQAGKPSSEDWPIAIKVYKPFKPAVGNKGSNAARRAAGLDVKDDYKLSGPQSGNARGLLSAPGEHLFPKDASGQLYCIAAILQKSRGKDTQMAFIRPLIEKGAAEDGTNKVFFGANNGYREMPLYFDDFKAAEAFFEKMSKAGVEKPELSEARVYAISPKDVERLGEAKKLKTGEMGKGGFFKFATEFGEAYCRTYKFNESFDADDAGANDITEDVIEEAKVEECGVKECGEMKTSARVLDEGGYSIDPIEFSKLGHLSDN